MTIGVGTHNKRGPPEGPYMSVRSLKHYNDVQQFCKLIFDSGVSGHSTSDRSQKKKK